MHSKGPPCRRSTPRIHRRNSSIFSHTSPPPLQARFLFPPNRNSLLYSICARCLQTSSSIRHIANTLYSPCTMNPGMLESIPSLPFPHFRPRREGQLSPYVQPPRRFSFPYLFFGTDQTFSIHQQTHVDLSRLSIQSVNESPLYYFWQTRLSSNPPFRRRQLHP